MLSLLHNGGSTPSLCNTYRSYLLLNLSEKALISGFQFERIISTPDKRTNSVCSKRTREPEFQSVMGREREKLRRSPESFWTTGFRIAAGQFGFRLRRI